MDQEQIVMAAKQVMLNSVFGLAFKSANMVLVEPDVEVDPAMFLNVVKHEVFRFLGAYLEDPAFPFFETNARVTIDPTVAVVGGRTVEVLIERPDIAINPDTGELLVRFRVSVDYAESLPGEAAKASGLIL